MKQFLSQDFNWHDAIDSGTYEFGKDGYLVMDGSLEGVGREGIECYRFLKEPITEENGKVEVGMRVIPGKVWRFGGENRIDIGKIYAIRLYDGDGEIMVDCRIDTDGWIRFMQSDDEYDGFRVKDVAKVDTGKAVTWCRGRVLVDPELTFPPPQIPYGLETDLHSFGFQNFEFAAGTFGFCFDDDEPLIISGGLIGNGNEISKLELRAFCVHPYSSGSHPALRIRLGHYREYREGGLSEEETFPIHWKPCGKVEPGYPHDRMEATRIRPVENRWLEITSQFGWITGKMPQMPSGGEVECEFKTEDVGKEFVIEMHQLDGIDSVAESNWPVKVGIIFGKFFCEYAYTVYSEVTKKHHPAGGQALCDEPIPVPGKVYNARVLWEPSGRYRWWIDGIPMQFEAVSRYTGEHHQIPGFESGGFWIPFLSDLSRPHYRGMDAVGLHYGVAGREPHVSSVGRIRVRTLDEAD